MRWILLGLFLLALALVVWVSRPLPRDGLECDPHPAAGYGDAVRLVDSLRAGDSDRISSECGTLLLTHGRKTHRVLVLLHGLTNCPAQFESLGHMSFARGANVLIPRFPHHGFADRMTRELAGMNAPELRAFTDRVLDAAQGLGDSITVAGLSMGGAMAAWAVQHRPGVDRAVLIAPMMGIAMLRGPCTPVVARVLGSVPNFFMWWDPRVRENLPGPRHVYPRYSTRSIAATLQVGWTTHLDARVTAPLCPSIVLVTVGGDMAVDNGLSERTAEDWRRHGARELITYEFPKSLRLNHDVVDPRQAGGNPAITYPVLTRLLGP